MMETQKPKKKSKITLTNIGLAVLVIVVAANIYIWRNNTAAQARIVTLTAGIAAIHQQIEAVPVPAADLESKLEAANKELADARSGIPNTVDRNEVIDYILDVAEEFDVQILPLSSNGWQLENIGLPYKVLSISSTAEGSLDNVKKLIETLQSGRYPTMRITDCSVERVKETAGKLTFDGIEVRVTMRIGIYTFAPDEEAAS